MNTGVFSPGVKGMRHEADHLPQSNALNENEWSYAFTPSDTFMACTGKNLYVF
jgi:hypothetical protein